jgi:hypothetical protein
MGEDFISAVFNLAHNIVNEEKLGMRESFSASVTTFKVLLKCSDG